MTKKSHQQVVIISAQRSDLSQDLNERLNLLLGDCLNDLNLNFKQGIGHYKDERALNYVVIVKNNDEVEALMKYAFENFNQESIFHQDVNGLCQLIYKDGKKDQLGKLRVVTEEETERLENFTILRDKCYTTERA